jgi:DNA-binding NarL/FixJ family response regulator
VGGAFPGQELLSARELEVARMVAAGAANREIAARLFITEGTVKNHVSSMLRKLGLRDRTQLALRLTGR